MISKFYKWYHVHPSQFHHIERTRRWVSSCLLSVTCVSSATRRFSLCERSPHVCCPCACSICSHRNWTWSQSRSSFPAKPLGTPHLPLQTYAYVRTTCVRTSRWHRSTVQNQLVPNFVSVCRRCYPWSADHIKDPSRLILVNLLNDSCRLRSRRRGDHCAPHCELEEELGASSIPERNLVSTCETRVGWRSLLLARSFVFALLSFALAFPVTLAVLVTLAELVFRDALSRTLAILALAVTSLAFVALRVWALHRTNIYRNWTVGVINFCLQAVHQRQPKLIEVSTILNPQVRPHRSWRSRQHDRTLQPVTERLAGRFLEIGNHVLPLQQFLLEVIRCPAVILQEIRVLVQRRPSRKNHTPYKVCVSTQSRACRDSFHDVQRLVLTHHGETHVKRFVCLSARLHSFAQLHDRDCRLVQPFLCRIVEETTLVTEHPLKVSPFTPVSQEISRLAKQLGIHSRRHHTPWTLQFTNFAHQRLGS